MAQAAVGAVGKKHDHTLRDFGGVNTQAVRQAIEDTEFAWLENMQPIGHGNLASVPGPTDTAVSLAATGYWMKACNINNADYMMVFCTDGSAYQIALSGYAVTTVGAAGTFNGSGTSFDQWKNERIIIADPTKGVFSWDGTTLAKMNGAVVSLTITAAGTGYTSRPTIAINGGGGAGASAVATIGAVSSAVTAGGLNYVVGDILTLTGGTGATASQFRVTTIGGGGAVTAVSVLTAGDYTATAASPAATTGGSGNGACTLTPVYGLVGFSSIVGGSGYTTNPSVSFSGGAGSAAAATAVASVAPSAGTSVAVYSGRVWIANNRTVTFSAPDSYTDFSTASFGGSFIISDPTLHSKIVTMLSANAFLYIVGNDSINVISDVRVSTSPATTLFSNLNLVATVGSVSPDSVVAYFRTIWVAAPYGFYGISGSTAQKGSDKLDGVFKLVSSATNISAGLVVINKIQCLAFLLTYADPVAGSRPLLAIYFSKKWFFASQGNDISFVASASVAGSQLLYGLAGTKLYKLFDNTSVTISQKAQTKLWDFGEATISDTQVLKVGVEAVMSTVAGSIMVSVDSENVAASSAVTGLNVSTWINRLGETVWWENNSFGIVTWLSTGFLWFHGDASSFGKYAGLTIATTCPGITISAAQLQYELRARW